MRGETFLGMTRGPISIGMSTVEAIDCASITSREAVGKARFGCRASAAERASLLGVTDRAMRGPSGCAEKACGAILVGEAFEAMLAAATAAVSRGI